MMDDTIYAGEQLRPLTVDEWLNTVNYADDTSYVPSQFALEFVNFIKMVNGAEGEENKTPPVHMKMLDNIQKMDKDTINMCHRGIAKSTLLGEYLILYLATFHNLPGFGAVPFMLYVSDSIDNGVKKMRKNLEFRWNNSEFLQKFVPEIKFTDIRWEFTNIDGKSLVVSGYGAKTGVRGTREQGTRPVLAILDDLISDEDARSATVLMSVEDTVYKAIDYALHPKRRKIIWSGTPFNAKDPLYKAVESGAWHVNVYPVCENFPCERKDFRGSWPDRFDYDYVKKQYDKAFASGKVDTFYQELMLRIMSDEDRLIRDEDIQRYDRRDVLRNKNKFNFYITTDFATTEKTAADYSVISVWALNSVGNWYWVDGICEKQDMAKNVDDLFRLAQMYQPQSVGVEITGQQGGFVSWIRKEMMSRNVHFSLASENNKGQPGIRPNTNKMVRFNVVVPWFKLKRVFLPDLDSVAHQKKLRTAVEEAVSELSLATAGGFKSKHDDWIDTVSMLSVMPSWRPDGASMFIDDIDEEDREYWDFDDDDNDATSAMDSYIV